MEPLGRDREGAGFMSRLEVGEFLAFFQHRARPNLPTNNTVARSSEP